MEIYADIWCPFAYVGLLAAQTERERLGRSGEIFMIRAWPLELVNGIALDANKTARNVRQLREQVAPHLFQGFDETRFPRSTLSALALSSAAYKISPEIGEDISYELRSLFFEGGVDISEPEVLADLAGRYRIDAANGFDQTDVVKEWHAGQSRGVLGSPHFFCHDVNLFCPSLSINHDENGALTIRRNSETLRKFLDDCFAT